MDESSLNKKQEETGKVEWKVLGLWNLGVLLWPLFCFHSCGLRPVFCFLGISLSRHCYQSFPPATRSNRQDVLVQRGTCMGSSNELSGYVPLTEQKRRRARIR